MMPGDPSPAIFPEGVGAPVASESLFSQGFARCFLPIYLPYRGLFLIPGIPPVYSFKGGENPEFIVLNPSVFALLCFPNTELRPPRNLRDNKQNKLSLLRPRKRPTGPTPLMTAEIPALLSIFVRSLFGLPFFRIFAHPPAP